MSYLSALAIVLGIVSGFVSLYEFIKSRRYSASWRPGAAFAVLALVMLVIAFIVANLTSASVSNGTKSGLSTPGSSTSVTGMTMTPILSPTPTSTPAPTSTPSPKPGTVLYQADWSEGLNGWIGAGDWNVSGSMLVNDGIQYESTGDPSITAPYLPQTADYAVQADIQLVRYSDAGAFTALDHFGIVVRSPNGGGGYKLSICGSSGLNSCGTNDYEVLLSNGDLMSANPLAESPFKPHAAWHTYRVEVKGNTIMVRIDGGSVFQVTDNKYLAAGRIGLWSDRCQISVRNFKIIIL
jgi:hypothetical protein